MHEFQGLAPDSGRTPASHAVVLEPPISGVDSKKDVLLLSSREDRQDYLRVLEVEIVPQEDPAGTEQRTPTQHVPERVDVACFIMRLGVVL